MTTTTEVENNTKHAVEPNKSSGSSPPLDAEGMPLVSGEVYVLREDFTAPRGPRSKKEPKVWAQKGDRFLFLREDAGAQFLLRTTGTRVAHEAWGRDEPVPQIVSKLFAAKHDSRSLVMRALNSVRCRPDPEDLLEQLIHDGRLSYDDLALGALLVSDHEEALDENSCFDADCENQKLADAAAQDAHENHFESRRGIYRFDDSNLVCLYDNNPWQGAPDLRDEVLAALKKDLEDEGRTIVAEGSFPKDGPHANYTRVILVRDHFGQLERIRELFRRNAGDAAVALHATTKA